MSSTSTTAALLYAAGPSRSTPSCSRLQAVSRSSPTTISASSSALVLSPSGEVAVADKQRITPRSCCSAWVASGPSGSAPPGPVGLSLSPPLGSSLGRQSLRSSAKASATTSLASTGRPGRWGGEGAAASPSGAGALAICTGPGATEAETMSSRERALHP